MTKEDKFLTIVWVGVGIITISVFLAGFAAIIKQALGLG